MKSKIIGRITPIEIAGQEYYLNFSTRAVKEITQKHGSLDGFMESMQEGAAIDDLLDNFIWLLAVLIDQGAEYMRIVEKEAVPKVGQEELEVIIGPTEYNELMPNIMQAFGKGSEREVETEPEKGKNAETTQGE